MYTNVRVDSQSIKLILDSSLANSIITRQLMNQLGHQVDHTASTRIITANRVTKTSIGKINNFLFEFNVLDWITQKLQLSQNGQQTYVPVMCSHFKTTHTLVSLIKLEEKKEKLI
ncbi:hypothetical protein G9A89_012679 [Geosiphon pyriformis]|nr:hypothetical protein G9A89_012679 [Geosiphon pyriformis]